MILDEADFDRDDAAPIDMLESYFAAHGWDHERQDDEVIAKVKGSWTQYELRALWREEDSVIQFLAFPDVRVADDRRGAIYEAIGLINEQLWVGHFELWSASGILLYRHAAMIEGATEAMTRTEERREDVRRVTDVFTTRSRALATDAAADMLPCALDCRESEIADWFIRLQI